MTGDFKHLKPGLVTVFGGVEMFSRKKIDKPTVVYSFDGATQYATIPDWRPYGLPYSVEATSVRLGDVPGGSGYPAVVGNSIAGNSVMYAGESDSSLAYNVLDVDGAQYSRNLVGASAIGAQVLGLAEMSPDGLMLTANGQSSSISTVPASNEATPIQHIARGTGDLSIWNGPIWNVRLTDLSPIQNRWVSYGSGSRSVELANPINLPQDADWEIAFDMIRHDTAGGTSNRYLLGNVDGTDRIQINDTGNANPDRLALVLNGTFVNMDNVFGGIAQDQHCTVVVKVTKPNMVKCYVDGVQKADLTSGNLDNDFDVAQLAAAGSTNAIAPESALANVRITDLTNDREFFYPLEPADLTAAIGQQRNSVFPADLTGAYGWDGTNGNCLPAAYGLEGNQFTDIRATPDDTLTVTLAQPTANLPVLTFGKFTKTLAGGPLVFTGVIEGIHKAFAGAAVATSVPESFVRLEWAEKGVRFTSLDAPNQGSNTGPEYDGIWTPDTDWNFIPNNDRHYPMNEGSGTVIKNILDESGATDGTIVGGDGGWTVIDT